MTTNNNRTWKKPGITTVSKEVLTQKIQASACSTYEPDDFCSITHLLR